MDEYIDEFRDLIDQAGYREGLTIVMKFCKGLQRDIQDRIATLANGCPDDADPHAWYAAVLNCVENEETNRLFCETLPTPRDDMSTHSRITPVTVPHEFDVQHMTWERYEEWKALQRDMAEIARKEKEAAFIEVQLQHRTCRQVSTQTLSSIPLVQENRFARLEVEEVPQMNQEDKSEEVRMPVAQKKMKKARWEWKLPRELTVVTTPSSNSLRIKVQIQATDTVQVYGTESLVDCSASGLFLDVDYVQKNQIETKSLSAPILVHNVDRTPNENGPIKEVANMLLHYNGHTECVTFAVMHLGKENMILGLPWLKEHNPEINWTTGEVKMS
jgi:phage terminase Nu1 subunit (DNA packaging protein)